MKDREIVYVGLRAPNGKTIVLVEQRDGMVIRQEPLHAGPSQKLWNHSPTGFEWGYGGSGPAQLALAILLDALGRGPFTVSSKFVDEHRSLSPRNVAQQLAIRFHQDFKRDHICRLDHGGWRLRLADVRLFLSHAQERLDSSNGGSVG